MSFIAIWQVADAGPRKLDPANVNLERHLEDWIEQDPDLVQFGLKIVGRQVQVDAGPLDLLALDPQGRWCVIEIKRNAVDRATIGQVQDYASCLSEMSEQQLRSCLSAHLEARNLDLDEELTKRNAVNALDPSEREISMFVVGTASAPGLDRMLRFLSKKHDVPIYAKTFNVFSTSQGDRVLIRETVESEFPQPEESRWQPASLDHLRETAKAGGSGDIFDTIAESAQKFGLQFRLWKTSVMFAPPTDGRRCLFTLWATPEQNGLRVYLETNAFAEFFPVTEEQALEHLGERGYRVMNINDAKRFSDELYALLHTDTS